MQNHPTSHTSNEHENLLKSLSLVLISLFQMPQQTRYTHTHKNIAVVGNEAKVQKKFWQPKLSELNENACNATFARVSHTRIVVLSIWIFRFVWARVWNILQHK